MSTVPTILHVPVPTGHFERNYGVFSTKHPTGQRVVIRLNLQQRQLIQRAAKMLEMTEAQYMREVSINTAKVVLKHAEEFNGSDNGDRS
jgi:uncharacterized protein (DUF1778 family)